MRIAYRGQVTIPADIRERALFPPQTEVAFELDGEVVRIVRARGGDRRVGATDWSLFCEGEATSR